LFCFGGAALRCGQELKEFSLDLILWHNQSLAQQEMTVSIELSRYSPSPSVFHLPILALQSLVRLLPLSLLLIFWY
jgi:hypothetical protein